MPTESPFPPVDIPAVDLWGLMFEEERREGFSDDQVIYRAIENGGCRHYTFADVKSTATSFGQGLRSSWQWQKGDVLALFSPNDIDIGPVIYGCFYAGGVVSPANPGYSAEELAFQLTDAGAKAIATQKSVLPVALEAAQKVGIASDRIILIGGDSKDHRSSRYKHFSSIRDSSGSERSQARTKLDPDGDLAFLVYSSGTTGLPKGVMLSHRNIIADVLMIQGAVGKHYSCERDKILGVLPFFHIYGLTGLVHQPLHRGIELVVMPAFNLEVFCRTIQEHKITFVYVAPPVLVRLARDHLVDKFDLSTLRMITSGAAPLTRELVDAVHSRLKIRINQAYGLSETSPMTHTQPWDEWYSSVGSVGTMFPNLTAKYVSAEGEEVEIGKTGELWLKGPNVFKGYWKNKAATKESLTDDGYFKTGDVGYQDRDQNFYITDRVKELIKYKGFQVAPAELEGLLLSHPLVSDVAVVGIPLATQHTEVPRAYIVLASQKPANKKTPSASSSSSSPSPSTATPPATEISTWLHSRVADHKKLRGGIRFVDEIPKSAAGKILRRVLREKGEREEEEEKEKGRKRGKAKL